MQQRQELSRQLEILTNSRAKYTKFKEIIKTEEDANTQFDSKIYPLNGTQFEAKLYPLEYAIHRGMFSLVRHLLELKADVNQISRGNTPLITAISRPSKVSSYVQILIDAKADVNPTGGVTRTPLSEAIYHDKDNIVTFLLKSNADINKADTNNKTPLITACSQGKFDIAKKLLDLKASPHHPSENAHDSAVCHAFRYSSSSARGFFNMASIDIPENIGFSLLLRAGANTSAIPSLVESQKAYWEEKAVTVHPSHRIIYDNLFFKMKAKCSEESKAIRDALSENNLVITVLIQMILSYCHNADMIPCLGEQTSYVWPTKKRKREVEEVEDDAEMADDSAEVIYSSSSTMEDDIEMPASSSSSSISYTR